MGQRVRWVAACALALFSISPRAQVNVTTYHNDNSRTGQNLQESILTPANVNSTKFGKLFTVTVDGTVYAQPLYLADVSIGGGTHNVLYVATEHDSIFAIDADTGTLYWQKSLIPAGGSTVSSSADLNCTDIPTEVGITGTPVIDPTTGTLYVVAKVKLNGVILQYLHALDVATAAEKFAGPVQIKGSVTGTASDGSGGVVTFNSRQENQRAALLLENGHVMIAWTAHCDISPWHGWVMSYSASTLAQEAIYNASPNGYGNGIWMSAGGLAADSSGNVYFATGNGSWDSADTGDSVVKLGAPSGGTLPVLDYFTPYDQSSLASADLDMSAGGVILLPTLANGQQLLTIIGKDGNIYLINRNNMGKYCVNQTPACTNSNPQIVQEVAGAFTGVWAVPAYWNGYLYQSGGNKDTGEPEAMKAFSFNANNSGLLSTSPTSITARTFYFSAPVPSISSNGTSNGILWGVDNGSAETPNCSGYTHCQILYAYDATNLATMLYNSNQAASYRDVPGAPVRFTTPTIANGKVYVGSIGAVSAFGLLTSAAPTASAPTFSPSGGSYTSAQSVSIGDATSGAVIYYTTDGSTPTTSSAKYSSALTVSTTTTLNAFAAASGYSNSAVSSATFTISAPPPPPTGTAPVSLSGAANIAGIYANGSTDSTGGFDGNGDALSATLVGSSVTSSGVTFTLGAAGAADALSNATLTLPAGAYTTLNLLGAGVNGNEPNQTFTVTYTDGTTSTFTQSLSDWFTPQNYSGESRALTMAYTLLPNGTTRPGPYYLYSYAFALNSAKTVKTLTLPANRNVVVLAATLSGATKTTTPASAPTFSPSGGSYTSAQSVSIGDATSGAVIYYTTDGSTPTTSSAKYSSALTVSTTTTLNAFAAASGYSNSAVSSATFTISAPPPPPPTGTAPVSLSGAANIAGIYANGSTDSTGGFDGNGDALSATLVGSSVTSSGVTFTLGAAGAADALSNATLTLPAGAYTTLNLLGAGVNGNEPNQTFTVTYTDGTTSTFTQSLSDWFTPQNYSGESRALTMAYTLLPNGTTRPGPYYLYSYAFTLNSAKTVKTLTLPANRNVVVLAATLSGATKTTTPASAPTFSPSGGSYTSAQSVSIGDATSGAVIYYTTDGSTPTTSSAKYSSALTVSTTTTLNAFAAASGYSNSAVSSATFTISAPPPPPTGTAPVSLSGAANIAGIYANGSTDSTGGFDGNGDALSATLVGSSVTSSGVTFTLGAAGAADALSNATLTLPAGAYTTLNLLGAGVNGNEPNQTFTVTYTDGTTSTFTQSLSDWFTPQNYSGESRALTMAYTLLPNGTTRPGPYYLYSYAFALNSAKTVKTLTLPANRNVVVLAATLSGASTGPTTPVAVSLASPTIYGIYANGSTDSTGGFDGNGDALSATLVGSSVTSSGITFTLGAAGAADALSNATLTLPAGAYTTLNLLGAGVNGNEPNQTFTVTYTDGTTSTFTQSLSDWFTPQNYSGESRALTMAYTLLPNGTTRPGPYYLYSYAFTLNSAKTVKSLTLPANRNVVVLAAEVVAAD